MCGILAILLADRGTAVNQELYDGLTMLQHRGQDAAGMLTADSSGRLHLHKDNGFVRDVFKLTHMVQLTGHYGIGHCRYPTAGASSNVHEAQPFVTHIPFGLCLAHNGNLTNTDELMEHISWKFHCNTDSDSELMLSVIADEILNDETNKSVTPKTFFNAVEGLMRRAKGGYAAVMLIKNYGIICFRDPCGIRPLCVGSRPSAIKPSGRDWIASSESVAMEALGYNLHRDVRPGEAIFIALDGTIHRHRCHSAPLLSPCIFEYVYFSRPDSIVDGVSVYQARKQMGNYLADKILREHPDAKTKIDMVVPVPETSRISALQCALRLGIPYEEGLTKNRYIARTFIMPGQQKRKKNVRKKLNPIRGLFDDKCVLVIDDSIVRGTTSGQIISMVRQAGAREVYFCSASPPIRFPNVYGIDMPVQSELIAFGRTEAEIAEEIGADWVCYQDLGDLKLSVLESKATTTAAAAATTIAPPTTLATAVPEADALDVMVEKSNTHQTKQPTNVPVPVPVTIDRFDCSCFDCDYITGGIDGDYFQALVEKRSDAALLKKNQSVAPNGANDIDNSGGGGGTGAKKAVSGAPQFGAAAAAGGGGGGGGGTTSEVEALMSQVGLGTSSPDPSSGLSTASPSTDDLEEEEEEGEEMEGPIGSGDHISNASIRTTDSLGLSSSSGAPGPADGQTSSSCLQKKPSSIRRGRKIAGAKAKARGVGFAEEVEGEEGKKRAEKSEQDQNQMLEQLRDRLSGWA